MPKSLPPIRPLLALAFVAALAVAGSGCGTGDADPDRGRVLFVQKCGTCHIMAEAGTAGTIGPDLDSAFAAARAAGMDGDTVEGVTSAQIENPRPSTDNPTVSMPADLVTGKDLEDVAAYVGMYAGVPGAAPPKVPGGPGAQVFANNGCGGCHILASANAGGVVGPNLDEVIPGQSAAAVDESIVDPNAVQSPGYPLNVMPQNYGDVIPADQLQQLVQYLLQEAGGGGNAAPGAGGPGAAGAGN
jgi:mono/diheme cytochrome c family protein